MISRFMSLLNEAEFTHLSVMPALGYVLKFMLRQSVSTATIIRTLCSSFLIKYLCGICNAMCRSTIIPFVHIASIQCNEKQKKKLNALPSSSRSSSSSSNSSNAYVVAMEWYDQQDVTLFCLITVAAFYFLLFVATAHSLSGPHSSVNIPSAQK